MLNPDAKPGGKTCRRRTASVEGSGAGNGNGGRGPDFKRRGRTKKNGSNALGGGGAAGGAAGGGGGNGLLRNGGPGGHHLNSHPGGGGGPDSTPSPNGPIHSQIVGGIELYHQPESPSLHHPSQLYPFPPGRLSPSAHGLHPGDHPAFGYPGPQQEWLGPNGDCQYGNMAPYFSGNF